MPSRRRLLAGVSALGVSAVAGCVDAYGSGSTPVPDELRATRVPPEAFPDRASVAVVPRRIRTALTEALDAGVADIEWEEVDTPVDPTIDETLVCHDGTTHEVVVETNTHAEYGGDLRRHDASWTPEDDREVVDYADLSDGGRAAFDHAVETGEFRSGGHVEDPWGADWPNTLPPVRYEGAVYKPTAVWVGDPPPHTTVWAREAPEDATGPVHDVAFPSLTPEARGILGEAVESGSASLGGSGLETESEELRRLVTDYDLVAFEEHYRLSVRGTD